MSERPAEVILCAVEVVRRYPPRGGVRGRDRRGVMALDRVSFEVAAGEIVGLVGRSGSGKSTLARVMLGLEPADAGVVRFRGRPIGTLNGSDLLEFRRSVQILFQDPFNSLDPRQSIGRIVGEPLSVHRLGERRARTGRVRQLLAGVGLPGDDAFLRRRPRELSGGERQRAALARALASDPQLLILDEPVSALDASVRGQVLNLLMEIRRKTRLAMLVIAHDITLVGRLCDRVAVMSEGRLVEEGPSNRLIADPSSPAAAELVAAADWLSARSSAGPNTRSPEPDPEV